nr:hypothetical protein CFP56_27700 [Quercus suber]
MNLCFGRLLSDVGLGLLGLDPLILPHFQEESDLGSDTICNDRAPTVPDYRVHILQPRLKSPSFHKLLGGCPSLMNFYFGRSLCDVGSVHTAVGNCGGSIVTNGIRAEVGSSLEGVKLVKTRGPKPGLKYVYTVVENYGASVVTNDISAKVGSPLEGVVK